MKRKNNQAVIHLLIYKISTLGATSPTDSPAETTQAPNTIPSGNFFLIHWQERSYQKH